MFPPRLDPNKQMINDREKQRAGEGEMRRDRERGGGLIDREIDRHTDGTGLGLI